MKHCLLIFSFILGAGQLLAQKENQQNWTANYTRSKAFIENLGQFDQYESHVTGKILYAVDFGATRIFFGQKGICYNFLEIKKKTREEREELMNLPSKNFLDHKQKEALAGKFFIRKDQVNMTWEGASSHATITGTGEQNDYHAYSFMDESGMSQHVNYVKGFEKLVYKNIYPQIDVEYTVHPIIGIKYAYILHEGADPGQIKMLFDRTPALVNGEIHLNTLFGDVVDHAPLSFYRENENSSIGSSYQINGNEISFNLEGYDNTKEIVIDPWVQTPNFPDNWDCVWELDTDAAGNVYVIGGIMPLQLQKYNASGALQWTHNTPYDTTSWLGTMATDDAGNTYVTNGTDYKIQKVNTSGALIWDNASPSGGQLSTEFWNITFNCDQTKLLVGGTGGNLDLHGRIYDVDMNSGNVNSSVPVTSPGDLWAIPIALQEVRAMTSAPNGKYYFITLDTIGFISDNLSLCPNGSSSLVMDNHGGAWSYKSENWRYNNTGIKVIRTDENFVYVHKGNTLEQRSLTDFSLLNSVAIPGGTIQTSMGQRQSSNAGIDIDDCGNIYVGSTNGVYKFNSSLVQQASYATTFNVYDVRVSTSGDIIACGGTGNSSTSNRSGGVQSFAAAACAPIALTCCDATICTPDNFCSNDLPVTLTTATAGGTWSGPGVNASGVFDPAAAGPGVHLVTYTLGCGAESISITVSPCVSLSVCQETDGSLTASNGVAPYTWDEWVPASSTPITNSSECTACGGTWFFGTCLSGVTPITTCDEPAQWSNFATGTTVTPPGGATLLQVTDNAGTAYSFDPALVSACASSCPTITVSTTAQTNVLCYGDASGSATVDATGGNAPYTYSWNPGSLTGATQSGLLAGTYTVDVLDNDACPGSASITITQPAAALSVSMSATPADCGLSNGSATATTSGGTGSYSYNWSPSGGSAATASGLASGLYTATVSDANGCSVTDNIAVGSNGGPTISLVSSQDITCFGSNDGQAIVSASGGSGGYTYLWSPGALNGASQSSLAADTYTVTVTDGGGCSNSLDITINEPAELTLSVSNIVSANCGSSDGEATVTVSGGTGSYSYNWSPSGASAATATNLSAGSYTVDVQDQNGCTNSVDLIVSSIGGPTVSIQSTTDVSCFGSSDGQATITATGGNPPYTYDWSPSGGSAATASDLATGTYNVMVTDDLGCIGTTSVIINEPAELNLSGTINHVICGSTGGSVSTSVNGGSGSYTYLWSPGNETTSSINNLEAGNYSVVVTDANGCSVSENYIVGATGELNITINPGSATIAAGESVQLTATGADSYVWTPATGLSCTTCANPLATPESSTTYIVTGTDANGCTGTEQITISIPTVCGDIFVPTVFSPNEEGPLANNTLCVYGNCISELNYAVYNRWGEKVFETRDTTFCWDGNYKGQALNPGVFAYKLVVTLFDGTHIEESGNVTLVR